VNVRVAFPAQNQGLPPPASHDALVQVGRPSLLVQVGEFADVKQPWSGELAVLEDVAGAVLFLKGNGFVTGTVFVAEQRA
jgi:hypothetical protein